MSLAFSRQLRRSIHTTAFLSHLSLELSPSLSSQPKLPLRSLINPPTFPFSKFSQICIASGARKMHPSMSSAQKEKVVILGSGWAGYILSQNLSKTKYNVSVVSPRSYFVFTPLLNDTTVGTLEFPHVVEPVRTRKSPVDYVQGWARSIDIPGGTVSIEPSVTTGGVTEAGAIGSKEEDVQGDGNGGVKTNGQKKKEDDGKGTEGKSQKKTFEMPFDKLVVAVGTNPQTFGTPGVKENALFLKDVGDARKIRRRILECFELAASPACTAEIRKCLLHFACVGGGPTGMEFAAILSDFITEDLEKVHPKLKGVAKVTVYDIAPKVLSMFDDALAKYAAKTMQRQGVSVKTEHHIQELRWGEPGKPKLEKPDPNGPLTLKIKEEGDVGVGMVVWTTGNAMNPLIEKGLNKVKDINLEGILVTSLQKGASETDYEDAEWQIKKHDKTGALMVDEHLRMQLTSPNDDSDTTASIFNVFALGDNAMIDSSSGSPPPTADTANQEALWLAKRLNKGDLTNKKNSKDAPKFEFANKGLITYIGDAKGLEENDDETGLKKLTPDAIKGKAAWLAWKGTYWNMTVSWRNKILILVYWVVNWIFGRDISRS